MLTLSSIPLAVLWLAAFSAAAMAATHDVDVIDNRFSPNDITIEVGDTVRWTNATGGAAHDVTADNSSFASITASSFMFERTFMSVAEVLYYCSVHSSPGQNRNTRMNGRVQVVDSAQVPPMANFTSSCNDLVCSFTDQSSDSGGTIASWSWDFDDGAISNMQNPGHTYAAAGTYTVGLTVTDNDGDSDTINKNVAVTEAAQVPPMANFTSSCNDLVCSFTDQSSDSDGTIASWSWDFDDGAISSMRNPGHTYAAAGTYTVGLTVTDNDGDSDTINKNVTVTEAAEIPIVINAAMSDAWFFPDTSGQGFFIIVWEDQKLVFLAWFTYDTERPPEDVTAILGEPGHRWLTALGPFDGDTALLDVFLSSGMIFDSAEPAVTTEQLEGATIEIVWSSCTEGVLKYDIPSLGLSGEIPIQRILEDNVAACEAAQP